MHEERTSVLIVGGGLTGLSTALFLAWHGVQPILVERHPDLLIHPRARGFTPRTVELFRHVGLEPAIRERVVSRLSRGNVQAQLAVDRRASGQRVIIDEALEVVRKFSTDESASFVNGVLDRIARESARRSADTDPAARG